MTGEKYGAGKSTPNRTAKNGRVAISPLTSGAVDPFDNQNEPRMEPSAGTPQREYEIQDEPRIEHGLNTDGKDWELLTCAGYPAHVHGR